MALGRPQVVSDEEILARARTVFLERGYAASTLRIAAAVGLSWAAIARRFQGKQELFRRAMAGPVLGTGQPGPVAGQGAAADLCGMLARLRADLWERWPLRLQYRLGTEPSAHESEDDVLPEWLAKALADCAGAGGVRTDMEPAALAHLVVTVLIGDVARRFVAREPTLAPDAGLIDGLVCMLRGR